MLVPFFFPLIAFPSSKNICKVTFTRGEHFSATSLSCLRFVDELEISEKLVFINSINSPRVNAQRTSERRCKKKNENETADWRKNC